MGHHIKAIIGSRSDIQKLAEDLVCAKPIELPQEFAMASMTFQLLEDVEEIMEPSEAGECSGLDGLDSSVVWLLKNYSLHTKLAYIETDYFGGVGTQGGVLYENGSEKIPPQTGNGTIDALLKELGVRRNPDKDEFDCLELGKYRHIEE